MSKRQAAFQISREGGDSNEDDEGNGSFASGPQRAAADVLSRRKIAVPRSRASTAGSVNTSSTNPFGGLKSAANPFGGLKFDPSKSSIIAPSTAGSVDSSISTTGRAELKIRALNEKFAAAVAKAQSSSIYGDWREQCHNYIKYYTQILGGKSLTATPEPSSIDVQDKSMTEATPEPEVAAIKSLKNAPSSLSASITSTPAGAVASPAVSAATTATSGITATGFKFSGNLGSSGSTFSFGNKTVDIKKDAKPEGSAQAPAGFVFQPGGKGQVVGNFQVQDSSDSESESESDSAPASAPESASKSAANPLSNSASNSASADSKAETKPESVPAPANVGFQFTFDKKPIAPSVSAEGSKKTDGLAPFNDKPSFAFGDAKPNDTPRFTFSASSSVAPATSTIGSETQTAKPALKFSFGQSSTSTLPSTDTKETKDTEPKSAPSFQFGAIGKPNDVNSGKPAFSFASPNTTAKDSGFKFGAVNSDQSGSADVSTKPKFSFSSGQPSADAKPAFTFGKPAEDSATSAATTKTDAKPAFSFGQPSNDKPAFTFGSGDNPFASKSSQAWQPGQPVKFAGESETSAATTAEAEGDEDQQNDPQIKLDGPGPGEENEDCAYEKRAKAFELADGQYQSIGLGNLRVLVDKTTKRSRALLRAEGSGRVLLNVSLRKAFTYSTIGKGQVKLLDIKPGEDKPVVYILRVKTEADGQELSTKLQEVAT